LLIIQKLKIKALNQNKTECEAMKKEAQQSDLLCSLDFIEGYVGALASPEEIRAAITEVMDSLRGVIMMPFSERAPDVGWQQNNPTQFISNTDTKCTLKHDASGDTQVIIEVSEKVLQEKYPQVRAPEPTNRKLKHNPAPAEETLPLVVQKSI
jgi:hypothetical protein